MSCCDVDAIVQVDARGQIVLPKDVRAKFGLEEGGKLALIVMSNGDAPCCISLMPAAALSAPIESVLQPVFGGKE